VLGRSLLFALFLLLLHRTGFAASFVTLRLFEPFIFVLVYIVRVIFILFLFPTLLAAFGGFFLCPRIRVLGQRAKLAQLVEVTLLAMHALFILLLFFFQVP